MKFSELWISTSEVLSRAFHAQRRLVASRR